MINDRMKLAEHVAHDVARLLHGLSHDHRIPFDVVLAAALGQVTTILAVNQGCTQTACDLRMLADQVESAPIREQIELGAATPAGRA